VPALGTNRTDIKVGCATTILRNDKSAGLNTSIDFTRTGKKGMSDDVYAGVVVEKKIDEKHRVAAGFNGTCKIGGKNNRDYVVNGRAAYRFTPGSAQHFEVWLDSKMFGTNTSWVPKRDAAITAVWRYNFNVKK